MAKNKEKTDVQELDEILFDTLGEFISPNRWKIIERPDGHYNVLCNETPECNAFLEDVNRGLRGTKFENKVHLYYLTR